jgi:hypothetical protein
VGAALAAGLVLGTALGAGWGARGERARAAALAGATAPAPGAPRFALLLYRDPARPEPAGIGHDALVAEYRAWARDVARRGHAVSGEELDERALAVGRLAPSGGEGGPLLVGFFVVSARSAEEAAAIARSCPHLRYGGAVVVRPISAT